MTKDEIIDRLTRLAAPGNEINVAVCDVMEKAAQELARTDTIPTWQPIETAPKDGTEVIVIHCTYHGDGIRPTIDGPFTAAFQGGKWKSSWDGIEVIEYMDWGGTDYKDIMAPTHWTPLPPAPEES